MLKYNGENYTARKFKYYTLRVILAGYVKNVNMVEENNKYKTIAKQKETSKEGTS